jgi:ligand-binding SRPBCC domain-containing protein
MQILIKTLVEQSVTDVWSGFNQSLFIKLAPPFIPFQLLRFDGCRKGDEVHIELSFFVKKQTWISVITENKTTENEIYFIDEGKQLPFFLSSWRHQHIIKSADGQTAIIDKIEFQSHNPIATILLYPFLFMQFYYRKPIYKKIFTKNQAKNEHT